MNHDVARVGIVGCGNISRTYVENMARFDNLAPVACADLDMDRATATADTYDITARSVDALLASDDIDVVLNLTVPAAHAEVAQRAVDAGKHAYNEKPLCMERAQAARLLQTADANGVRVGCAPDTFLGAGYQTCRRIIDRGDIGKPIVATAYMVSGGPERWHPSPHFFFEPGGGPVFDMAPYYFTALVHLLGPIRRVTAFTGKGLKERVAGSGAHAGEKIPVMIDTTATGALEFVSGAMASVIFSFDVKGAHHLPQIEVHGADGSIACPDPNGFGGPVRHYQREGEAWDDVGLVPGFTEKGRGLGLSDMMAAHREGRPHRAGGALANHVLDAMHALYDAGRGGRAVTLESTCDQPAALAS